MEKNQLKKKAKMPDGPILSIPDRMDIFYFLKGGWDGCSLPLEHYEKPLGDRHFSPVLQNAARHRCAREKVYEWNQSVGNQAHTTEPRQEEGIS